MKFLHAYLKKRIYEIEFLKCNMKKNYIRNTILYTRDIYFQTQNFETKYRKFVNIKNLRCAYPSGTHPRKFNHHTILGRATRILPIFNLFFYIAPRPFPPPSSEQIPTQQKIKHWLHHHWSNQLYATHRQRRPPESCPPTTDAPPPYPPNNADASPPPHIFLTDMIKISIKPSTPPTRGLSHQNKKNPAHLHWISISTQKNIGCSNRILPIFNLFFCIAPHPSPSPSSEQIPTQKNKTKNFLPTHIFLTDMIKISIKPSTPSTPIFRRI